MDFKEDISEVMWLLPTMKERVFFFVLHFHSHFENDDSNSKGKRLRRSTTPGEWCFWGSSIERYGLLFFHQHLQALFQSSSLTNAAMQDGKNKKNLNNLTLENGQLFVDVIIMNLSLSFPPYCISMILASQKLRSSFLYVKKYWEKLQ